MKPSTLLARIAMQSQKGFSLLEISLVIALGTMVSIGYLYNQSQDSQLSNAKVQAGYYLTAINVMGSSGFMSLETVLDSEGKGMLYGVGKQTSQANPIVFYDSKDKTNEYNDRGITGIMALQNAADVRCTAN